MLRSIACCLLVLTSACATRAVLITAEPHAAFIQIDGTTLGRAPRRWVFDFAEKPTFTVSATAPGYFRAETTVTKDSLDAREIKLVLVEDPSWRATTASDAANAWVRLSCSADLPPDQVWQKLVDALTDRFASLEQIDATSGYLRTAPFQRRFRGPDGDFKIRTRVVSALASRQPLVYKLKIECERAENEGDWQAWNRPFKEDAALLEELQGRLASGAPVRGRGMTSSSAPATIFCPACGARIPASTRFCPDCGKQQ